MRVRRGGGGAADSQSFGRVRGAGLIDVLNAVELHACDIDPAATRCARRNLDAHGAHAARAARVHQGDLYRALPVDLRGRVDVVVANAPYVPRGHLLVEASADQAPRAADLMTERGMFPQVRPPAEFDATIVVGLRRLRPGRT